MSQLVVALAVLGAVAAASAEEPAAPDELARIATELAALKAESAATRQQLAAQAVELERLRAAQQAQLTAPSLFRLGGLAVRASGFVQADGVAYHQASQDELNPATGEPLNQTRFAIRRARLRLDGEYKWVSGLLELDGNTINGATARLTNAEISLQWPPTAALSTAGTPCPIVQATFGLMRIPFGFEVQQKDFVRLFLERSTLIRALFPGEFDLGVRVQGAWRFLRYQLAGMNGNPAGDRQFAARDPSRSKDLLGRLGIETAIGARTKLAAGLSGLYGRGFSPGAPATKDTLVWRDTNLDGQVDPTELLSIVGMPAVRSRTFARYAFGADLRVHIAVPRLGELVLLGELVWASNLDRALYPADPVAAGRDLRELGWYLGFTQELTRWAMIGVRYDRYDPDADSSERIATSIVPRDRSFSTIAVALAGLYAPYARLVVEYDHHTNALGRKPSGAPTTLGSDVLTLRAQAQF